MSSIRKPTIELLTKSFGNLRSVINLDNDSLQIPFLNAKSVDYNILFKLD